jgi:hypothetical protein
LGHVSLAPERDVGCCGGTSPRCRRNTREGYMTRIGRCRLTANLLCGFWLLLVVVCPVWAGQGHRGGSRQPSCWKQLTRASWYGGEFRGRRTANGSRFDPQRFTAAHRTLHLGSRVRVTEMRSGRSVVVQINDRGPYVSGRGIDLSYAAAKELGMLKRGTALVRVELLTDEEPMQSEPMQPMVAASRSSSTPWLPWLPKKIFE